MGKVIARRADADRTEVGLLFTNLSVTTSLCYSLSLGLTSLC